jgi:hypothetical protein
MDQVRLTRREFTEEQHPLARFQFEVAARTDRGVNLNLSHVIRESTHDRLHRDAGGSCSRSSR